MSTLYAPADPAAALGGAAPPREAYPDKKDTGKAYQKWQKRLTAARTLREKWSERVWKPLYDAWVGRLCRLIDAPEPENRFSQYVSVVRPHLVGNEREVVVRVSKINARENPDDKMQFAELLGDQATALGRSVGLESDAQGRSGEVARAITNAMWGLGVMLLGFELPRGTAAAEGNEAAGQRGNEAEGRAEEFVDLDFATADHRERNDAGTPFARSIDPRRFLADATYKDFTQGAWCGIEYYLSVAEAKARFPDYKDKFKQTHQSAPLWDSDAGGDEELGQEDGVIGFVDIYQRHPRKIITVPHQNANCPHIVEEREWDLGIEGLPVRLLGFEWPEGSPYPKPPLADFYDGATAACDFKNTVFAAGNKLKTATLVDEQADPGLAAALATGNDSGVYKTKGDPRAIVHTVEAGALRREHLDLAASADESFERNSGLSDLALGRRERGNQTVPEIEARQSHITSRLANLTDPVRLFEAAVYSGLVAVAYSKLDLLHGTQFPLDAGQNTAFVAFDANAPMIGEMLDYAFVVYVNDAVSNADETAELNALLPTLQGMQPLLQAEGVGVAYKPLVEALLRKSRVQRAGEVLYMLPPAPPQSPAMDPNMAAQQQQQQQGGQPAAEQPPAPAAPPAEAPPPDPAAELEQLYALLPQIPEGDPSEEAVLRRIAELQAVLEQVAPAAA